MPVVKFYANLRRLTGHKEVHVPGNNLRQILKTLERDYPALKVYLDSGAGGRLIITLNGHPLDPAVGYEVPLGEDDQVAIFPPIAGG